MRIFHLVRDEDYSGVSGTGVVAEGVEWTNGEIVLHWLGTHNTKEHLDCIAEVEAIHGHEGRTRIVFEERPSPKKLRKSRAKIIK